MQALRVEVTMSTEQSLAQQKTTMSTTKSNHE